MALVFAAGERRLKWLIDISETGPTPGMMKREFNRIVARAYRVMGIHWHREFLPKHFTAEGGKEYGYAPRAGAAGGSSGKAFWRSYTGRKIRSKKTEKPQPRPLVYSGESRLKSKYQDVRSNSKGGTVVLHLRALNFTRRKGSSTELNMRTELTSTTPAEQAALARTARRFMTAEFRKIRGRTTERV